MDSLRPPCCQFFLYQTLILNYYYNHKNYINLIQVIIKTVLIKKIIGFINSKILFQIYDLKLLFKTFNELFAPLLCSWNLNKAFAAYCFYKVYWKLVKIIAKIAFQINKLTPHTTRIDQNFIVNSYKSMFFAKLLKITFKITSQKDLKP